MQGTLPNFPFSFFLAGASRVGTAVSLLLAEQGHKPVGVWSRSADSARKTAVLLGAPVHDDPRGDADVYLIGTADSAVATVAAALAPSIKTGSVACHFAGSLATDVLSSATEAGAAALALHPVQACPSVEAALQRLPGSAWGVTATPSPHAAQWATRLVEDSLQGRAVIVPAADRPAWHSAAVITSNGVAALLGAGESILHAIGIDDPVAVLGPLAAGTIDNAIAGGGGAATLTGPAVRGEAETIRRHLDALRGNPRLVDAYVRATRTIVAVALNAGRLDSPAAERIEVALKSVAR